MATTDFVAKCGDDWRQAKMRSDAREEIREIEKHKDYRSMTRPS